MIADVRAALDFAIEGKGDGKSELPRMDRERVFLLGYSLGGMVALYAAALDERVRGVASFSGFTPMRDDSDSKHTGGIRRLWDWHGLVPRLGLFHGRESTIPYDYEDVLKLIAPRPCLLVAPQRDRNADLENVIRSVESARGAWGESEQLTVRTPDRVDRFQRAQHELFLSWMRRVSGTE